jgi:CheY-like chemotaxis protein
MILGDMPDKRILVVDDEQIICDLLVSLLSKKYDVAWTTIPEQALVLCSQSAFDLVISDINMPSMSGIELLARIRELHGATVTVLMTGYNTNDYLDQALENGVSNIISKTVPFNFNEIETLIEALLAEAIFGLKRYLLDDGVVFQNFVVRSSAEAHTVRDDVTRLFVAKFGTAGEMNLILDEIITNALYHAPVGPDGNRKYQAFDEIRLEDHEFIEVECGFDSEKYGVSVVDPSGRLSKRTVLEKIHRQVSGKGVLDEHGRGIHMSRLFSDRMIINIKPMVRTEVILMNYFTPKYHGYKPLYINELKGTDPPR